MHWGYDGHRSPSDPLNATIYSLSTNNDSASENDTEFNGNTIINNINVNTYNNINNIQVNSINEINYIIPINNISTINNYNTTNNIHTINNNTNNVNITNGIPPIQLPQREEVLNQSTGNGSPKVEKDKRARLKRTTTHHKRRGSDSESSPRMEEKYQRRHSEGKVLRIAGIREQVSQYNIVFWLFKFCIDIIYKVRVAVLQILNANYAEIEDEWPAIHALLQGAHLASFSPLFPSLLTSVQGVDLSCSALPPPPRHLVHAGFVHDGEQEEEYWIDDTLLLLFKDFLLVACQPKNDATKVCISPREERRIEEEHL
jgi:hypothetical protein